jgi:hypothetical protein
MDLTTKTETIQFGETKILGIFKKAIKFKVVADIPDSMLEKYAEIAKIKPEDTNPEEQRKTFTVMKDVVKAILYQGNKVKTVDKFVDKLGIKGANKAFTFLNEYINEVDEEKKNESKTT